MRERASEAGRKLVALTILLLAAYLLFKFVVGAVTAVLWVVLVVAALIAVVWALRVL